MAELIHEHHTHIRTPEGAAYMPHTYAAPNADGVWEMWLRFQPVDHGGPVLETGRESSQATRDAAASWAAGLETAYFEGAFARAHPLAG